MPLVNMLQPIPVAQFGGYSVARLVLVITTNTEKVIKHALIENYTDYQAYGKSIYQEE